MPFQKGMPRPANAGRKKGSVNRTTAAIKQAWVDSFDLTGGVPALVKWAKANRTAYYSFLARLMPSEIKADVTTRESKGEEVEEVIVRTRAEAAALMGPKELPDVPAIE